MKPIRIPFIVRTEGGNGYQPGGDIMICADWLSGIKLNAVMPGSYELIVKKPHSWADHSGIQFRITRQPGGVLNIRHGIGENRVTLCTALHRIGLHRLRPSYRHSRQFIVSAERLP